MTTSSADSGTWGEWGCLPWQSQDARASGPAPSGGEEIGLMGCKLLVFKIK